MSLILFMRDSALDIWDRMLDLDSYDHTIAFEGMGGKFSSTIHPNGFYLVFRMLCFEFENLHNNLAKACFHVDGRDT